MFGLILLILGSTSSVTSVGLFLVLLFFLSLLVLLSLLMSLLAILLFVWTIEQNDLNRCYIHKVVRTYGKSIPGYLFYSCLLIYGAILSLVCKKRISGHELIVLY